MIASNWPLGAVLLLSFSIANAYETDPYTNRHQPIADSGQLMDQEVNRALDEIAGSWRRGENERAFVRAVYHKLGGWHWVDRYERWLIDSDQIAKLDNSRKQSIYAGVPLYANRVAGLFGFAPTIKVWGSFVGTDKFGHFFSQGRKFYERYLRMGDEAEAAQRSAYTESAIFGQLTTGVYSNADVVANFEGYRFYRSLFHALPDGPKSPIFVWRNGVPVRQRAFSWQDHINAFWDEAINANHYDRLLRPHLVRGLMRLCGQYLAHPDLYAAPDFENLRARYRHIGLRDTSELSADAYFSSNCDP